jgi:uncharacterized protein (TIGR02217 family)
MPITVLSDVVMPNSVISSGVRGKNMRQNARTQTEGGYQSINVGWNRSLRQYEIGTVPMLVSQWQAIEALFEITEGGAYGFLMEDPKDCVLPASDSALGAVITVQAATPYLQLVKRYTDTKSGRTKDRPVTRPQVSTIKVFEDGMQVDAVVDPDTGRITGINDPSAVTWTGRYYVPVHFVDDFIDWDLIAAGGIEQRYLAGPSVILQEVRE